jgi:CBS domain-containing protein
MSAGNVCSRDVDVASVDESAQAAALRMHARKVGTLVVVDGERHPLGIVTDRDLAIRVVSTGIDAGRTSVGEIMSAAPETVWEDTPIEDALATMRRGPFRRVLVVDNEDRLIGLLSLDDILMRLGREFGEIQHLISRETPHSLIST